MKKVDLHVHSSHSDGSEGVNDLLKSIIKANINIFALSDHDTVAGCEEMQKLVPSDIKFIPAVELTCQTKELNSHILGYGIDYKNKILLNLIEKGKKLRRIKLETRIEYLKDVWNIELTEDEQKWLYSRTSVVKTHFANILVKRGLAKDNVSAMKKYLDDCRCPNTKFSIEEGINTIKEAGGISVWAHPLGGEGEVHINENEFLQRLEKMKHYGIKGLECYYSRYNDDESAFLAEYAKNNALLISGGSDYHGSNKDIPLGRLNSSGKNIDASKITILNFFN